MQKLRHRWLIALIAAGTLLTLQACGSTNEAGTTSPAELAAVESGPVSDAGVTPYTVDNPGPGGNVTCEQIGYESSSERVNLDDGGFDADFPAGVEVVTDGTNVAWTSTFPIGAVIVKGGAAANVYEYMPPALSDGGLTAPANASGGPAGLSNLTFCWNSDEEEEEEPELEVTKTAMTTFQRSWDWTIDKVEKRGLTVLRIPAGESATAYYQLTVGLEPIAEAGWMVSGGITIENVSSVPAAITGITDVMTGDIAAAIDCDADFSLPYLLDAGETLACTYGSDLPDATERTNTVTVTVEGGEAFTASAPVTFGEPSNDLVFACTDVYDNLGTGDVMELNDYVYFGKVCFDEDDGLSLSDLTGKAYAEIVGYAAVFSYAIEIGADGTAAEPSDESVAPTCDPAEREFTNRAKILFDDGTRYFYYFDDWTINVIEVPADCSGAN